MNLRELEQLPRLVRSLTSRLDAYAEALGPMWTTVRGVKRPLALLSTGHLQNILEGASPKNPETIRFINAELDRRAEDEPSEAVALLKQCLAQLRTIAQQTNKTGWVK